MEIDAIEFDPYFASQPLNNESAFSKCPSVDTRSTLSVAEPEQSYKPTQPTIAPPNALFQLSKFYCDLEETTERVIQEQGKSLHTIEEEMKKLQEERNTLIEREAAHIKMQTTWSMFSNVADYLLNLGSIMTGSPLLMASGIIGIATKIGHDTELIETATKWITRSEYLQEKLIKGIDSLAFVARIGLSLSGSVIAWNNNALFPNSNLLERIQKASATISSISGITGLASMTGEAIYQNKVADIRSKIKVIESDIAMKTQNDIPANLQTITKTTESIGQEYQVVNAALDLLRV